MAPGAFLSMTQYCVFWLLLPIYHGHLGTLPFPFFLPNHHHHANSSACICHFAILSRLVRCFQNLLVPSPILLSLLLWALSNAIVCSLLLPILWVHGLLLHQHLFTTLLLHKMWRHEMAFFVLFLRCCSRQHACHFPHWTDFCFLPFSAVFVFHLFSYIKGCLHNTTTTFVIYNFSKLKLN